MRVEGGNGCVVSGVDGYDNRWVKKWKWLVFVIYYYLFNFKLLFGIVLKMNVFFFL